MEEFRVIVPIDVLYPKLNIMQEDWMQYSNTVIPLLVYSGLVNLDMNMDRSKERIVSHKNVQRFPCLFCNLLFDWISKVFDIFNV